MKLLNEQVVEYRPKLLAITDESGPVALGGVMGGHATMVGDATTDVFFEAAFFDPEAVQGKARELQLTSDAAYRYERGVDFGGTRAALERATQLTLEICGGQAGPVTEAMGELPQRDAGARSPGARARAARLRRRRRRDGARSSSASRARVRRDGGALRVTPPTWRFDLAIEEDFVEEIARIHGYEHVPAHRAALERADAARRARARATASTCATPPPRWATRKSSTTASCPRSGSATSPATTKPVRLANPIASTMSVMRTSLLGGLGRTPCAANLNRGEDRVRLFEIGRCFEGEEADLAVQPERIAALAFGLREPGAVGREGPARRFLRRQGRPGGAGGRRRPSTFEAGDPSGLPPGALRRSSRPAAGPWGSWASSTPACSRSTSCPSPPVVFEVLTEPLLRGAAPRFPGPLPHARRCAGTWPFTVAENLPVGPILEAAPRAASRASSGRWKCSTSTAERASRPGEKALRFV